MRGLSWVHAIRFDFLFLLVSVGLLGQPVIETPVWTPQGFSADILAGDYFPPTPAADEPQSWDFSDVSGSAISLVVEPASQSPYVDAFTDADWMFTNGDQLTFWNLQDGVVTVVGNANAANGVTLPFDDRSSKGPIPWSTATWNRIPSPSS